jgi:hypothetical protein
MNAALPDVLNTFLSRFEHNDDSELLRRDPEDNEGNILTASTENVCKSFKPVYPRKAADPDDIPSRALSICADQLAIVFVDIFILSVARAATPTCFKMSTHVIQNADSDLPEKRFDDHQDSRKNILWTDDSKV